MGNTLQISTLLFQWKLKNLEKCLFYRKSALIRKATNHFFKLMLTHTFAPPAGVLVPGIGLLRVNPLKPRIAYLCIDSSAISHVLNQYWPVKVYNLYNIPQSNLGILLTNNGFFMCIFIPPAEGRGVYWFEPVRPSVGPSVRLLLCCHNIGYMHEGS